MGNDVKHMHMVADVVHAADGRTINYGPGEMHEPGTLPDGVPYRDVLATPEQLATAPAHAKAEADAPKTDTAKTDTAQTAKTDAPAHPAGQAGGETKAAAQPGKPSGKA